MSQLIQYQGFHTGDEFVARLTLGRDDGNKYDDIKNMFETLRDHVEGDSFAFAPVGNSCLLMQYFKPKSEPKSSESSESSERTYTFVKGLLCDGSLPEMPSRYIDKFSVESPDPKIDKLPQGKLPDIERKVDDSSLAMNLHHIFAKVIDALLYDEQKKPIVIITDKHEDAVNYIKVLSLLLPVQYMKNIGFCIGAEKVHNNITFFNSEGNKQEISVRIWAPEVKDYHFDTYACSSYVFEVTRDGERDNYDRTLSPFARAVDSLDLGRASVARDFVLKFQGAFRNDGSVDWDELEQKSNAFWLQKQDVETAKRVLTAETGRHPQNEELMVDAIQILLDSENTERITSTERSAIIRKYKEQPNVAQQVEEPLFHHLAVSYPTLAQSEKQDFFRIIANDESGRRLEEVLRGALHGDYKALLDGFELALGVLKIRFEKYGACVGANKEIIKRIVEFFDLNMFHQKIPTDQHTRGEDLFNIVWNSGEAEFKHVATAILLNSVYSSDAPQEFCTTRIKGFKRMLEVSGMSALKQIEFIVLVRDKILEISVEVSDSCRVSDEFDFLFNNSFGCLWMKELIDALSIEEALDAEAMILAVTARTNFYGSLSNALRNKLLNIEFVKANVKSGHPVPHKYLEFFSMLPEGEQNLHMDVKKYLGELNFETGVSDLFSKYRADFAFDCYQTLSLNNRQKIAEKTTETAVPFYNLPKPERNAVVEETLRLFGIPARQRTRRVFQVRLQPFMIWSVFWALLSALVLLLPAFIQTMLLGSFDSMFFFNRIGDIQAWLLILVPLYVFLLNILSYTVFVNGNRVKRANILTVMCGLLPVLMFVLSYVFFYFLM